MEIYITVIVCIHWEDQDYHLSVDESFKEALTKARKAVGSFPVPSGFERYAIGKEAATTERSETLEWEGWQIQFSIGKL